MTEARRLAPKTAAASARQRLLVTRPAPQAVDWVAGLRQCGIDAEALPLIEIAAPLDGAAVDAEWRSLAQRRMLVFVSPSAVERFFMACPAGIGWPPQVLAAAPGPGTRGVLAARGVALGSIVEPAPDSMQFDSESLWAALRQRAWNGASVLIVRGDGGREWLAEQLQAAGARVDFVSAYRRTPAQPGPAARLLMDAALEHPAQHAWLFSSSEAIECLVATSGLPADDLRQRLRDARALTTHPKIASRARAAGFGCVETCRPTLEAVVACLQSGPAAESPSP